MYCTKFSKQLALVLCSMALFACKPASDVETKNDGKTLAEVNGTKITVKDFNAEVENLPPYIRPMAQTPEGKKELLESMVVRELVLEQAKKDGIDKSKEVVTRLEDLKKRVVVEAFVRKKIEQDIKISDDEMKKFYDQNKDKFKSGEQVKASHILVKSESSAQDILSQLKKGASFEELARKNSADASAAKGGDLGWFSKGTMVPEFDKVAFGLKDGELSNVVKTPYGFHIIKVTGKRAAGVRSFDEVKDQIKAAMMPAKQQEVLQQLKESLKKNAKISIKEDVLNEVGGSPAEKAPVPAAPSK
ncbi:MAG: peptidylprolyl isomerase [Geobacteraceae bacterium]|nr:peptidylprolyl isomerase [Geobacteraceae bacterium]